MKKKDFYRIAAYESPADDFESDAQEIIVHGIKDLILLVAVAGLLGVVLHRFLLVAFILFVAFMFARMIYLKSDRRTIQFIDRVNGRITGETNTGYVRAFFGLIFLVFAVAGYYWICGKLFPAYGLYQVFVMLFASLALIVAPIAQDIYGIVIGTKIKKLWFECLNQDKTPLRDAYYKGLLVYSSIGRWVWMTCIALILVGLIPAYLRYTAKAPQVAESFTPVESYYSEHGPYPDDREKIPEEVLTDLSHGEFQVFSSIYEANYRYETEYNGFTVEYDIYVKYEFVDNDEPYWVVRTYKCNEEHVKAVNHSGVWTGTGTDDKSADLFSPECTFTLTFETLTESEAKGTLRLVGTDGTQLYYSGFSGTAVRNGDEITADVVLDIPRQTFAELHTSLRIEVYPTTEQISLGLAYPSATLTLNRK